VSAELLACENAGIHDQNAPEGEQRECSLKIVQVPTHGHRPPSGTVELRDSCHHASTRTVAAAASAGLPDLLEMMVSAARATRDARQRYVVPSTLTVTTAPGPVFVVPISKSRRMDSEVLWAPVVSKK